MIRHVGQRSAAVILILSLTIAAKAATFTPLSNYLDGTGFLTLDNAFDLSSDGSKLVGHGTTASGIEAFYWTADTNSPRQLVRFNDFVGGGTTSQAFAISGDGRSIGGWGRSSSGLQAFLNESPTEIKRDLKLFSPAFDLSDATARSVNGFSADGRVIVGSTAGRKAYRMEVGEEAKVLGGGDTARTSADGSVVVFGDQKWIGGSSVEEPPVSITLGGGGGSALNVSGDGSTVVGIHGVRAAYWDESNTVTEIGALGGGSSSAKSVSYDGNIIVGSTGTGVNQQAFYYERGGVMQSLQDVLVNDFGLSDDVDGWSLRDARAISDGGKIISGSGVNPSGQNDVWIATLGAEEPPAIAVLEGVPDYLWNYGCLPTAAGTLMGYWDRKGFGNLVGDESQIAPMASDPQVELRPTLLQIGVNEYQTGLPSSSRLVDELIASEGHHRDYWAHGLYGVASALFGSAVGEGVDPLVDNHPDDSLADYLNTSRGAAANGNTSIEAVSLGLRRWATDNGYTSSSVTTLSPNIEILKSEIEDGNPVLVYLSLDGIGGKGHAAVAYGYRQDTNGEHWLAVRDGWQNGDSNGLFAIESYVDVGGVEWWKWSTESGGVAYAYGMTTFSISLEDAFSPIGVSLLDNFNRIDDVGSGELSWSLGYGAIDRSVSQTGLVDLAESPFDPGNIVLSLTSITGEPISAIRDVETAGVVSISFDYYFQDPGKLELFLDNVLLATLRSEDTPDPTMFSDFTLEVDLAGVSLENFALREFEMRLSSIGDPTLFIDNLSIRILSSPYSIAIPEPSSICLFWVALIALGVYSRHRDARYSTRQ